MKRQNVYRLYYTTSDIHRTTNIDITVKLHKLWSFESCVSYRFYAFRHLNCICARNKLN